MLAYILPNHMELLLGALCLVTVVGGAGIGLLIWALTRDKSNPQFRSCPDCGRAVSPQAPSCPGCGRPLNVQNP